MQVLEGALAFLATKTLASLLFLLNPGYLVGDLLLVLERPSQGSTIQEVFSNAHSFPSQRLCFFCVLYQAFTNCIKIAKKFVSLACKLVNLLNAEFSSFIP